MNKLIEIYCRPDAAERQMLLSLISNDEKKQFGLKLVAEIFKRNVPKGSPIVTNFIGDCWFKVLSFTQKTSQNEEIIENIKNITNWLKNNKITLEQATQWDAAYNAKKIIKDEKSSDKNFELACELLKAIMNAIDFTNFELEQKVFDEILGIEAFFRIYNDKDFTVKVKALCKLYVALAEKFMPKIVINSHGSRRILTHMLEFAKHPELTALTFNFWRSLPNNLKDSRQKEEFSRIFEILMINFAFCIKCNKTKPNPNVVQQKKFQEDISAVISKIAKVLNLQTSFSLFMDILYDPKCSSIEVEISLLMIESVAEHLPDSPDVTKLIEDILLVQNSSEYFPQSVKILGQFGKWINSHPDALISILNFLSDALTCHQLIADAAAQAFKNISRSCEKLMTKFIEQLYTIFANLFNLNLSNSGQLDFIKAICSVVNCLPDDQLKHALRKICKLQFNKINSLQNSETVKNLDQLCEIFNQIKSKASASVFIEFWPALGQMLNDKDEKVLEKVIECVKCAVESNGVELLPILEDIIEKMLCLNNSKVLPLVLKLFNAVFDSLNDNNLQGLLILCDAVSILTFHILLNEEKFNALLVEEFFSFVNRFALKCPIELVQLTSIIETIELAIHACSINESNLNAFKFLHTLLTIKNQNFDCLKYQIMSRYGDVIIHTLLTALTLNFNQEKFNLIADILDALKTASLQAFSESMKNAILSQPNLTKVGPKDLEDFFLFITRVNLSKTETVEALTILRKILKQEI